MLKTWPMFWSRAQFFAVTRILVIMRICSSAQHMFCHFVLLWGVFRRLIVSSRWVINAFFCSCRPRSSRHECEVQRFGAGSVNDGSKLEFRMNVRKANKCIGEVLLSILINDLGGLSNLIAHVRSLSLVTVDDFIHTRILQNLCTQCDSRGRTCLPFIGLSSGFLDPSVQTRK